MTMVAQRMNECTAKVAVNEYPNPPWNTISYEWDADYAACSPEWYAQHLAKFALKSGLQYSLEDPYAQYRTVPDEKRHVSPKPALREGFNAVNGVLTDGYLYYMLTGKLVKRPLVQPITHIGDILQLALDCSLQTIWVLAGTVLSSRATEDMLADVHTTWGISSARFTPAPGKAGEWCSCVVGWKLKEARGDNESGREVAVMFAEYATGWALEDCENPISLLATVTYLEDALEKALKAHIPIRFSPGNVGKEIMHQVNTHWKREPWLEHASVNACPPVANEKVPQLLWKRALSEEEQAQGFVVAYDKNSQYPASCTSVMLGVGKPELVEHPTFMASADRPQPGLWYCRIISSGSSNFDGVQLPHPTHGKTEGWFWSYTVKLLYELGYQYVIDKAYIWKDAHTTLRPFAEKLWGARAALKEDTTRYRHEEARDRAQAAVKLIMNVSLGWLDIGHNREIEATETPWYHRPDWYQLLRDNAYYQMFWRIRSYLKKGFTPIGVYEDCLYYAADECNHETALPGMMDRSTKLGGFKRKYKQGDIPISAALPLFNNPRVTIQQVNTVFNNLDEQE